MKYVLLLILNAVNRSGFMTTFVKFKKTSATTFSTIPTSVEKGMIVVC